MGQKVHPVGFRIGVFENWRASWFSKRFYGRELIDDLKIRDFLKKNLNDEDIDKIIIEKAGENIRIIIYSSRPGYIIGKKGMGIDKLRKDFFDLFKRGVEFSIQEVKNHDLSASLIAKSIASQLVKRVSFKRAMKKAGFAAMKAGAKGIKICCSGRLAGAEIARNEWFRAGSVPLHTLRSNVDFALAEAKTTYGIIGVKVWVCRGAY